MESTREPWSLSTTNRYSAFRQATRRHAPSRLVPVVAAAAAEQVSLPFEQWKSGIHPWVYAAMARDCILYSDELRSKPINRHAMGYMHNLFINAYEPHREPALLSMMLGYAYEQMWYQRSDMQELARSYLLYTQTVVAPQYEHPNEDDWSDFLNVPLKTAMTASFTLFALTVSHAGSFDPAWIESSGYDQLETDIPREAMRDTLALFTTTVGEAKERSREINNLPQTYQRHAFNPLIERPFVDIDGGLRYAPQPRFVVRALAAEPLYYRGIRRWGTSFGQAFGARIEAYTGMQLRHTGKHKVIPEFTWHKRRAGTMRSSDWFLVTPAATFLIECKSARMSLEAKAGTGAGEDLLERYIGRAYQQLSNNAAEIRDGNPDFKHIPGGNPLIGLVVTAEPMFGANRADIRDRFASPSLPVLTASLNEIELIAALEPEVAGKVLLQIARDARLSTWNLDQALVEVLGRGNVPKNQLIQQVFSDLTSFSELRKQREAAKIILVEDHSST